MMINDLRRWQNPQSEICNQKSPIDGRHSKSKKSNNDS